MYGVQMRHEIAVAGTVRARVEIRSERESADQSLTGIKAGGSSRVSIQTEQRGTCIVVVLAAAASAGGLGYGGHGGHSVQHRKQDDHGNFNFGYNIVNGYGATNGRHESGSAYGGVRGAYYLADVDGRSRRVEYVADKLGFRAVIKTNEPGTKSSLPAAAPYISAHGKAVGAFGHGGGYGHGGYGGHGFYG
ncbi:hypothetical protein HPB47_008423 [Ixodes persulcatus]|uniref:Uncharacterized protein n=1 Tax=Ixodes persulcatus TaxID=34615 RepID=A0AC60P5B5_IXOPE|nr:hypothetical protein HPB47_008423 [Ixodes persulcatus]